MRGEELKMMNKGNSRNFTQGERERLCGIWRESRKEFLLFCLKWEKLEYVCLIKGITRFSSHDFCLFFQNEANIVDMLHDLSKTFG